MIRRTDKPQHTPVQLSLHDATDVRLRVTQVRGGRSEDHDVLEIYIEGANPATIVLFGAIGAFDGEKV